MFSFNQKKSQSTESISETPTGHSHGPGQPEEDRDDAVLGPIAELRVDVMGVCAIVFGEAHGGATIVMPDARRRRRSRNEHDEIIPAHHAFVIVERARLINEPRVRLPDLYFGKHRKYAVFLLDREQISIGGGSKRTVGVSMADTKPGAQQDPAWVTDLGSVCKHMTIAPENVAFPPGRKVLAHMTLRAGTFYTGERTPKPFLFDPRCTGVITAELRHLAQLASFNVPLTRRGHFELLSEPFDESLPCGPIRIRAKQEERPRIMVGNAPLGDVDDYLKCTQIMQHPRDFHFELFYDLAIKPPAPPYPIPECREQVPRVGGCPPVVGSTG